MNVRPSVLCAVDYSQASASALRYAVAIARRFDTHLLVVTVDDPLLTAAMDFGTGVPWTRDTSEIELARFVGETFANDVTVTASCEYEAAVGKPAVEILRIARERSCDLIVMSSHGLTGVRKLFFGSTTERVLRETTIPVLVTPATSRGPIAAEDVKSIVRRIAVPVDLTSSSLYQTQAACRVADALNVPLVLIHVIEPLKSRLLSRLSSPGLDATRRAEAEERLERLQAIVPPRVKSEALVVVGDPAEEACKVVRARQADLIVMGLHGSPMLGPRMGSVTYRMLCLWPSLVLALPPRDSQASRTVTLEGRSAATDAG